MICQLSFLEKYIPSEVDSRAVCYPAAVTIHVQERAILAANVHKLQEQLTVRRDAESLLALKPNVQCGPG